LGVINKIAMLLQENKNPLQVVTKKLLIKGYPIGTS
jgi:hypothetical protein